MGVERGEMGEQLGVRKIPEADAIISHGIGFPHDIIEQMHISVVVLVECLKKKDMCHWTTGGGDAFSLPTDCRNVI
jgi:hypothetical protein